MKLMILPFQFIQVCGCNEPFSICTKHGEKNIFPGYLASIIVQLQSDFGIACWMSAQSPMLHMACYMLSPYTKYYGVPENKIGRFASEEGTHLGNYGAANM